MPLIPQFSRAALTSFGSFHTLPVNQRLATAPLYVLLDGLGYEFIVEGGPL
jgi:hypothetical protein